jgi:hypothetical protein
MIQLRAAFFLKRVIWQCVVCCKGVILTIIRGSAYMVDKWTGGDVVAEENVKLLCTFT